MPYLIVFLGASLGGALRHLVNVMVNHLGGPPPIGTLAINIAGSFMMGVIAECFALHGHLSQAWRQFFTTGNFGGFTTFSAFSLEAVLLYERGHLAAAAAYVLGSMGLSIGALFVPLAIMRILMRV